LKGEEVMCSRHPTRLTAVGVACLLAFAGAPTASASSSVSSAQAKPCTSGPWKAKIKLAKRSGPGRSYHFKGWMAKGKRACIDKAVDRGGYYPNCGGGRAWVRLNNTESWVAATCLKWDK